MLAGPQGIKVASWRSRMRRRDLWTCLQGKLALGFLERRSCYSSYVCRVGFTHDDVEDRDVAAILAWAGRDHAVLGLQQSAHHI